MWVTVLGLGLVAAADLLRIGATMVLLGAPRPVRALLVLFGAGFAANMAVNLVLLVTLGRLDLGGVSVPAPVRLGAGVALLVVVVVVGVVAWRRRGPAVSPASLSDERPPRRSPTGVLRRLRSGSPAVAAMLGLVTAVPTAFSVGAVVAVDRSGLPLPGQTAVLAVFTVVAFSAVLLPLASRVLAPEATARAVTACYSWLDAHRAPLLAIAALAVAAALIASGL